MLEDVYNSSRSLETLFVASEQCELVVQVLSLGDALCRYIKFALDAASPTTRALWMVARTLKCGRFSACLHSRNASKTPEQMSGRCGRQLRGLTFTFELRQFRQALATCVRRVLFGELIFFETIPDGACSEEQT